MTHPRAATDGRVDALPFKLGFTEVYRLFGGPVIDSADLLKQLTGLT